MCATLLRWRHLVNAYEVTAGVLTDWIVSSLAPLYWQLIRPCKTLCYCCPARQAVRYICMYYMLVRLSVCLNHIKGTIIIIIIIITTTTSGGGAV